MRDINAIVKTIFENIKRLSLDYTNTTVRENLEGFDIIVDIRIEKESLNPYGMINTIPQINIDDILPKKESEPI